MMSDLKTKRASVMCLLCRTAGTVEMNTERPEGAAGLAAAARHFKEHHPDAPLPVAQHLVVLMQDEA